MRRCRGSAVQILLVEGLGEEALSVVVVVIGPRVDLRVVNVAVDGTENEAEGSENEGRYDVASRQRVRRRLLLLND